MGKSFLFLIICIFGIIDSLPAQSKFENIEITSGINYTIPYHKESLETNNIEQGLSGDIGVQSSIIVYYKISNSIYLGTGFSFLKERYHYNLFNMVLPTDIQNGTISTVQNETSVYYIGIPIILNFDLTPKRNHSLNAAIRYFRNFYANNKFSNTGAASLDPGFNDNLETSFPKENISIGLFWKYNIPISQTFDFIINTGADVLLFQNENIIFSSASKNILPNLNVGIGYKI